MTISQQEINSEAWQTARYMCDCYHYDIHEIAAELDRFRAIRAEYHHAALDAVEPILQPAIQLPANLVHFNTVKQYWNPRQQRWSHPDIVYIGRAMTHPSLRLPASPFANPFRIEQDTDDLREDAIELYANWITLPAQAHLLARLNTLRGKTLVCWCKSAGPGKPSRSCHGDVLIKIMLDNAAEEEAKEEINHVLL